MDHPALLEDLGPEELHTLLSEATIGVYRWDVLRDEMSWSESIHRTLGTQPGGRSTLEDQRAVLHPDDQEPWFRLLERSRKPGGLFSCEMRLRRSDNRYIWVRSNAIWLPRGGEKVETLLGFILDVEEVRQAREAVRRSEARFRAFFDHAPIAAFIKDADHRYLYVNDMTASIVGLPLEHILGRTVEELFSPEVAERLADVDRRVLAGQTIETWSGEVSSVDGRQHQMLDIKFPVQDLDTDELLVGGFGLDVTEERQAQARLQSAQRLESLGVLAGGVAHDFNNLLVAILGNAELARTGNEEERENCLTAVVQTARRASELCEQLLAYAGRSVTRKTVLHVPDFIRGTHDLLAISTRELCDVRLQFHDSCPGIEFDPGQLQQIVMNLVMNAAQASPTKDSVVTVECDAAHRIEEEGASVIYNWVRAPSTLCRIRVADEGEGLASETVARIFDPFFTTKSDGHGLGLAAVLGIVKANAGAIQVNSAPGHGTSISIYLPSTNQPISTDAPVRPNSEHTAVQGTVLVVDDEASVADVCRLLLERMGLDVIVVSTGQEAIEITATQSFELVVLDLTMPHIGGIEVLKAIRTNRPAQAVMLSSGYTEDDVGQFLDTKTTFLRKPYTAGEFKHAVAEFLTATTTEADKAPSKKVTE